MRKLRTIAAAAAIALATVFTVSSALACPGSAGDTEATGSDGE